MGPSLGALLALLKEWHWLCACGASAYLPHVCRQRYPHQELPLSCNPVFSCAQYLNEHNCRELDSEVWDKSHYLITSFLSVCVCIICMCVYTRVYVYIYAYISVYICMCVCVYIYIWIRLSFPAITGLRVLGENTEKKKPHTIIMQKGGSCP